MLDKARIATAKKFCPAGGESPACDHLGERSSDAFHDRDAVEQAILELSESDLLRLKHFAMWRIRGLGRKARGRTHEDLLGEAITSILSGRRPCRKSIKFYVHLEGCIRSISNGWAQKNDIDLWFDTELGAMMRESKTGSPAELERARDGEPDPEQQADVVMQMARVHRIFPCGTTDRKIIDCWENGQNHAETQTKLGLSKKLYDAAVKRIRRTAVSKRAFIHGKEYM